MNVSFQTNTGTLKRVVSGQKSFPYTRPLELGKGRIRFSCIVFSMLSKSYGGIRNGKNRLDKMYIHGYTISE